jgi:hypothetical protein
MPDISVLFPILLLGAVLALTLILLPLINADKTVHLEEEPAAEPRQPLRSAETRPLPISRSGDTQPIQLND